MTERNVLIDEKPCVTGQAFPKECKAAFDKWLIEVKDLMFAERGAWEAWQAAWDVQAVKLEACVQEMTGGCPT